ncbi:MAG: acetoacetate--CoA ligase [Theionarchaea archaeon]|nr:acetoacetate--CoA ligase [Theionarchaea archaeon]MBU7038385.1 acetoacetate--CoA ligase [Theionarchaea archaeon]
MKKALWYPSEERKRNANMTQYMNSLSETYGLTFRDYHELYEWSVRNREDFWSSLWHFFDVRASRPYGTVLENPDDMLKSRWFQGATLNFAENLLRHTDQHTALVFKGETQDPIYVTYGELFRKAASLAASLKECGVAARDRVVGFMPNMIETVVAMLATASLGAIWSSCSPDFGIKGVLDRFGQIEPKVLFTADGYSYKGKRIDSLEKISGILEKIQSIEKVVVVPYAEEPTITLPKAIHYEDFQTSASSIQFEQVPFDHPLYILYTSGTTGAPKCMVHGVGGTLLQHMKELVLHTNLKRDDTIFYFTTCGWMMWNWLVSSLAVGSTVILFDGNPFYPDEGALFQLAEDTGLSVFGTSAKYLAEVEKAGLIPSKEFDLNALQTILSTGSPLSVESFDYVYRSIREDVQLSSISGGSDIISCFALGCPLLPVYPGELQCRGLGMKVEVLDENQKSVVNRKGDLVCAASFPSQPIFFWNDPYSEKYKNAYFDVVDNVWVHGDFAEITDHGGVIIYGRSDATLNPGGVRIGTAEIYREVDTFPEVVDSIVVGQPWRGDVRVILFVKMREGTTLTDQMKDKVRKTIQENCSPRHVPSKIIGIEDIPYTISGKKVEVAVRKIIEGRPVYNRDALSNPEALDLYRDIPELSTE